MGNKVGPIEFLQRVHPERCWLLTAIDPDGKGIETKAFPAGESQATDAADWIDRHNGSWNVYYSLAEPMKVEDKKATREKVAAVHFLHVDVDPEPGADLAAERVRIEALLRKAKPTILVDSGGGFQGLWELDQPIPVQGSLEIAEQAALHNKALELRLGGDSCSNVDRILRLPGTLNVPGKKKLAKGRVPAEAKVVSMTRTRYSVHDFTQAAPDMGSGTAAELDIPADVQPLDSVDALDQWGVSDRLKVIAVQGKDPDQPLPNDNSQSAWDFTFCLMALSQRVPAGVIRSVLLDPNFGIGEHVRRQTNPEKKADQFIKDAAAKVRPMLDKHNADTNAEKFLEAALPHLVHTAGSYVNYLGPHWVELEDMTVEQQLQHWLRGCDVMGGTRDKPFPVPFPINPSTKSAILNSVTALRHLPSGSYSPPCWLGDARPFPADEVLACHNGLLHLPTGSVVPPTPDFFTFAGLSYDYDPEAPEPTAWLAFLESVWPGNGGLHDLLQEMMGYLLVPTNRFQKMFVLIGPPRSGKGTISRIIRQLVGPENCAGVTARSLAGDFGLSGLVTKSVGFMPDVRTSNKTDMGALIENLLGITGGDLMPVNRKHKGLIDVQLNTRLVLMSNEAPRWPDTSGALANRMIPLPMEVSWLGREDHDLDSKLEAELAGILNWAIVGYRRLHERGRFELPAASKVLLDHVEAEAGGVSRFLADCCEIGAEHRVEWADLLAAYGDWCQDEQVEQMSMVQFGRDLMTAGRGRLKRSRGRADRVLGLRLSGEVTQEEMPF